ncbi:MAG: N-acetylneuraminate synthase [Syntrophomonadaceae bacterium]
MKKVFIIAEAGVNHNGSLELAKEMIKKAAESGADAVKFQTFRAERVISLNAPKAEYQLKTTGRDESQLQMVKKLELNEEEHRELARECLARKIEFLSTPFDLESIDLLLNLDISRIKIGSGDITNSPLLLKAAQSQKEIILSTGMSTLDEVKAALGVLAYGYLFPSRDHKPSLNNFQEAYISKEGQAWLSKKVSLLHCTTEYPAPYEEVNLRAMDTLKSAFRLKVGYSDHTRGINVPVAAAARGAFIIEKHFTLDRNLPGPDHMASVEPEELKAMVSSIRQVELALGSVDKKPSSSEEKNLSVARRSLVALDFIKMGELFTKENLGTKRPGNGISAVYYFDWLGKKAQRNYERDEQIKP